MIANAPSYGQYNIRHSPGIRSGHFGSELRGERVWWPQLNSSTVHVAITTVLQPEITFDWIVTDLGKLLSVIRRLLLRNVFFGLYVKAVATSGRCSRGGIGS